MNFCGGGVDQQVNEPPILSMAQLGPLDDDLRGNSKSHRGQYQQQHNDDPATLPTSAVKYSKPQVDTANSTPRSTNVRNEILKINKKKLQQPHHQTAPVRDTSRTTANNFVSRARTRGIGKQTPVEDGGTKRGTEINLPANQRQSRGRTGVSSFSNMKTLDTLLKRLENGFRVTIHNGSDPSGKRVFLTLLQNRTCLLIRPVEDDVDNAPSIKFPVRTILRLEIGKTKSSVLGRSIYDHIPPMTCFSIVVKLWSEAETYFDFEASSVIEREALISTLMVVLDQIHNTSTTSPSNRTNASGSHSRKETENKGGTGQNSSAQLSSDRRTKMHAGSPSEEEEDHQEGMEISLPMEGPNTPTSSTSARSKTKPLRQRQLQPAALAMDDVPDPLSSPRTPRIRQSPKFLSVAKPTTPVHAERNTIKSAPKSPYNADSPLEVVVVSNNARNTPGDDEQRDGPPGDTGYSHHPNETPNEVEVGQEKEDSFKFEISNQGLPVSKIHFSPTRDLADGNSGAYGCCDLTPNKEGHESLSQQVAWCTDDICTLALRDIAETCTGMFDHPDNFPSKEGCKSHGHTKEDFESAACKPGCTAEERVIVEEYIAGVLGGNGGFFSDGDAWNVATSNQTPTKEKATKNRIKNRASLLNAQAMRLRTLRNEMTFAAAVKRSKEKMQYVQTTKSFDDADSERLRQAEERSANRLHSSALMQSMIGGMVTAKPGADEDDVYYDSDPEDVRPRIRDVRRASANRRNAMTKDEEKQYQGRPVVLSGIGFEKIAVGKKLKKLDEELIVEVVQAMRNETLTLMWHPTQSAQNPNRSPVCVNLWIESGVYLVDGSFLLPRLSWSVAYEDNLNSRRLNVSQTDPEQIDLLDVCRIRVTEKVDRKLHPFADVRKSFVIDTQEEVYMFEAQTADERNRIVYGYKLVIARLASLLMLRDSRAVEEFFGSTSAMVPGGFTVGK